MLFSYLWSFPIFIACHVQFYVPRFVRKILFIVRSFPKETCDIYIFTCIIYMEHIQVYTCVMSCRYSYVYTRPRLLNANHCFSFLLCYDYILCIWVQMLKVFGKVYNALPVQYIIDDVSGIKLCLLNYKDNITLSKQLLVKMYMYIHLKKKILCPCEI